PVTGDDLVDGDEAGEKAVSITGSVGGDASEGDTVTLTIGGQEFTGTVDADNNYAIDVPGSLLAANDTVSATVTGSDDAGNDFTASAGREYGVDTAASATITIDPVTGDDLIDGDEAGQEAISITGSVGGDASEGDTVTLTVGGQEFTGTVDAD
ncbi:Ig-like domain-containing protein, partial [Guyparkeria halopsychrophila]|uniref:Ig-like domain-containing protein n=1 Tax=Guyparkeria halopsychrophila TaxID=3139421 RepID=UPI0037C7B976